VRLVNERFLFTDTFLFDNILFPTPDTKRHYNALIARLMRRFSNGLQFDAIYRFAKSTDVVSYEGPTAKHQSDLSARRAPGSLVLRTMMCAITLSLPDFGILPSSGIVTTRPVSILGGWQLQWNSYRRILAFRGLRWSASASARADRVFVRCGVSYRGGAGNDTSNNALLRAAISGRVAPPSLALRRRTDSNCPHWPKLVSVAALL